MSNPKVYYAILYNVNGDLYSIETDEESTIFYEGIGYTIIPIPAEELQALINKYKTPQP